MKLISWCPFIVGTTDIVDNNLRKSETWRVLIAFWFIPNGWFYTSHWKVVHPPPQSSLNMLGVWKWYDSSQEYQRNRTGNRKCKYLIQWLGWERENQTSKHLTRWGKTSPEALSTTFSTLAQGPWSIFFLTCRINEYAFRPANFLGQWNRSCTMYGKLFL